VTSFGGVIKDDSERLGSAMLVRISQEAAEALARIAEAEDRPVSYLVRTAVDAHIARRRPKRRTVAARRPITI
jgi:predicted transcriptional regulator